MGLNFEHGKETFWNFSCGKNVTHEKFKLQSRLGRRWGDEGREVEGRGKGSVSRSSKKMEKM